MKALAIAPDEFNAELHQLPIAGELLLPGVQAYVRSDGVVLALKQALLPSEVCGTVVELCRQGDGVEVALNAEQQEDGGFSSRRCGCWWGDVKDEDVTYRSCFRSNSQAFTNRNVYCGFPKSTY